MDRIARKEPFRLLLSSTTKEDVHDSNADFWSSLTASVEGYINLRKPLAAPFSYSLFLRYREKNVPTLRITKSGIDFCDFCTTIKSSVACLHGNEDHLNTLRDFLEQQRKEERDEVLLYKDSQREAHEVPDGEMQHFEFDFAEKGLLSKLLNQPGQLHFITCLEFDLFEVSSSYRRTNYVFGLLEGHSPNEKTANVVLSMLHHVIETQKKTNAPGACARHLPLLVDNCNGQNKNKYVLWYVCWRVFMGLNDSVELCFLIDAHTKNVCDGAFGLVKRCLNQNYTHTPADMMAVIESSSLTKTCVPSAEVYWRNWKSTLSAEFKIPSGLAITKFHVFNFHKDYMGSMSCRRLGTEEVSESFAPANKEISESFFID